MIGSYTSLTPILLYALLLPPHLPCKAQGSSSCQAGHLHLLSAEALPSKLKPLIHVAEFGSLWFILWIVSRIYVLNLLWGIADLLPQFLWNYCLNCWGFFYSKINRICLKTVQKIKKIRGQGREDNCWGIFQEMWFHQHNKNSLCVITGHTVTFLDTVHACRHKLKHKTSLWFSQYISSDETQNQFQLCLHLSNTASFIKSWESIFWT